MSLAEKGLAARVARCLAELALANELRPQSQRLEWKCFTNLSKAVSMAQHETKWQNKKQFIALWREGCGITRLCTLQQQEMTQAQRKVIAEFAAWAEEFEKSFALE
jgi:hypothetical protein